MEQKGKEVNIKDISKSGLSVYNFSDIELPKAIEKAHEDFITYGDDNLFPDDLIEAWLQSPTHNALTTGIVQMIAGEGLNLSDNTNVSLSAFVKKANKKGESLDDIIRKTSFDLYLHGYYGWQIIWNKAQTNIAEMYHVPAEQIRSGKINKDTMSIEDYYVSWDWSKYRKKGFKPIKIKAFDPEDRTEARQMIFVKQYRPSQYYYSTPSYIGGMNWILLDNAIGEFHLNNIENGFFPNTLVQFFNGEPTQEEKRNIEQKFISKFTGKKQAKIVFAYNDNQDKKVSFETHEPANVDKRFKELMPEVSKNIMISHRVPSPLLFGIRDSGGLGNNAEELESSSILMNKMVIIPLQQIIIENLAKIFKINGWPEDITIETLQPGQWLEGNKKDAEATTEDQSQNFSEDEKKKIIPEELVTPIINHLKNKGEKQTDLEDDGWILVEDDGKLTKEGIKLKLSPERFNNISSDPEDPSYLDRGLYKIRYEYRGPRDDKNRDFCAEVLDLNLIFRKEDIDTMTSNQANPEFGIYSIWDYKGSYGCRHRWHRLIFFRKRNNKGQFLPNEGLENDKTVGPGQTPAEVVDTLEDSNATTVNKNL
jgi:hypothetical protein